MRIRVLKCHICSNWHLAGHCPYCGAYRLRVRGSRCAYVNRDGLLMGRALPMPVDKPLTRLIAYAGTIAHVRLVDKLRGLLLNPQTPIEKQKLAARELLRVNNVK